MSDVCTGTMFICLLCVECCYVRSQLHVHLSFGHPHSAIAMDGVMWQLSFKNIFTGVIGIQMYWFMGSMAKDMWRTHTSVTIQLHHIP